MSNTFQYTSVCLNFSGTGEYKPINYLYSNLDQEGKLVSILAIYVNGERIHAGCERKTWDADHQVAARKDYLGIQEEARKWRPPYKSAGSRAGSIVSTNDIDMRILVSEDIQAKMKNVVLRLQAKVFENPEVNLCNNYLILDRVTLRYETQTYDPLNHYLKGLHVTIDGWHTGRDYDDCKVATARRK